MSDLYKVACPECGEKLRIMVDCKDEKVNFCYKCRYNRFQSEEKDTNEMVDEMRILRDQLGKDIDAYDLALKLKLNSKCAKCKHVIKSSGGIACSIQRNLLNNKICIWDPAGRSSDYFEEAK